ncbi:hypothetical protein Mgra_00005095 [Meloidogyne graminicola]|uniref:Uncharacterized protein n=1 Tax=Meloidogyne graminicola TaxID=189291 RepID=A0A8S9ZQQ6_9BILA|nr:hypothetical protein Mgra_00005095 [Meloidogyne graminicola]
MTRKFVKRSKFFKKINLI